LRHGYPIADTAAQTLIRHAHPSREIQSAVSFIISTISVADNSCPLGSALSSPARLAAVGAAIEVPLFQPYHPDASVESIHTHGEATVIQLFP
jgi:hypothetical protein